MTCSYLAKKLQFKRSILFLVTAINIVVWIIVNKKCVVFVYAQLWSFIDAWRQDASCGTEYTENLLYIEEIVIYLYIY